MSRYHMNKLTTVLHVEDSGSDAMYVKGMLKVASLIQSALIAWLKRFSVCILVEIACAISWKTCRHKPTVFIILATAHYLALICRASMKKNLIHCTKRCLARCWLVAKGSHPTPLSVLNIHCIHWMLLALICDYRCFLGLTFVRLRVLSDSMLD